MMPYAKAAKAAQEPAGARWLRSAWQRLDAFEGSADKIAEMADSAKLGHGSLPITFTSWRMA